MEQLTPLLHLQSSTPIYMQLYHYMKKEIENGRLAPGSFLPSIRKLSLHLQVSKNTVENAYQQLIAEGYVESIPRVGLKIISLKESWEFPLQHQESSISYAASNEEQESVGEPLIDFVYGDIDIDYFPIKSWKKYIQEALQDNSVEVLMYGEPFGDRGLREQISQYLLQSRGFSCNPEQIVITAGTQHAVSLLCQLLALHGSTIAIEEPGYDGVRSVFVNQGCTIQPVLLEEDGISISGVRSSNAKLVYVTPSHQLPFGMIMPVQKRIMLLQWAADKNGYVLEDDYDSEFRYKGQPIPALKALDKQDKVIYLGTFSKCMLPANRVSYLVLPTDLVDLYKERLYNYNQACSPIIQRALYFFMKNGDFERHIRRMKKLYQTKQNLLLQAIEQYMGKRVEVIGERSGLHILVKVDGRKETELIEKALAFGVKVYSLSKFYHHKCNHSDSKLLLGFGHLNEKQIEEGIRLLQRAWFTTN